jgi:hypothetical protein
MKYEDWIRYERARLFAKKRIGVMPTRAQIEALAKPLHFPILIRRQAAPRVNTAALVPNAQGAAQL